MIRPEALAALLRWREAAIGAAAALLGASWAWSGTGPVRWIGVALILGGVAIVREGLARARRPPDGDGTGLVEVDERQITYLTASGGGAVSIDAVSRVSIETGKSGHAWHLDEDGRVLRIPGSAAGAGQIFDALAALPGFDPDRAAGIAARRNTATTLLWSRDGRRLPSPPH